MSGITEDVAKKAKQLTKLYENGSRQIMGFWQRYDNLCEDLDGKKGLAEQAQKVADTLFDDEQVDDDFMRLQPPLDAQRPAKPTEEGLFEAKLALAENKAYFMTLRRDVEQFVPKWNNSVLAVLEDEGATGLRLQFETSEPTALHDHIYSRYIPDVRALGEMLVAAEGRLLALPKIITDIQQHGMALPPEATRARYIKGKRTLVIGDRQVAFQKNSEFRPHLCEVFFDHPKKTWTIKELQRVWDDNYEFVGAERPSDWQRVYDALTKINDRVRKKTGIDDLFVFDTSTARLNPKYL